MTDQDTNLDTDTQDTEQDIDTDVDTQDVDTTDTDTTDTEDTQDTEDEEVIDPEKVEIETRGKKAEKEPIDYGDDVDPEDAKTIGKIVEKQREEDRKELQSVKDEIEVNGFLQAKPEFQKYKPVILKYMQHPAYSNIPVKNIAAMVASNDLMKIGAKKEREAQATADATKTKGSPVRKPSGGGTDWANAPVKDVEEQIRKIKSGQV